jgi:hypothetical protein
VRVLELGTYIVPAYAGMLLAEQGHQVTKWISPTTTDPVEGLHRGDELWAWLNEGKCVLRCHARAVVELAPGEYDIVIDNIRASTWASWGVDPAAQADRLGVTWVSVRDDFDERSFDAIAQARAWGDHCGYLPFYIGDTTCGLWLAFKALAATDSGHHVLRQAACLAKLVEGELLVDVDRDDKLPPWDEPGTYGPREAGVAVVYRGQTVTEPYRDSEWRRTHLRHAAGRYQI